MNNPTLKISVCNHRTDKYGGSLENRSRSDLIHIAVDFPDFAFLIAGYKNIVDGKSEFADRSPDIVDAVVQVGQGDGPDPVFGNFDNAFDAAVIQFEILHKGILPVFASSNIIQLAGVVKRRIVLSGGMPVIPLREAAS